jgi:hypothetical protein
MYCRRNRVAKNAWSWLVYVHELYACQEISAETGMTKTQSADKQKQTDEQEKSVKHTYKMLHFAWPPCETLFGISPLRPWRNVTRTCPIDLCLFKKPIMKTQGPGAQTFHYEIKQSRNNLARWRRPIFQSEFQKRWRKHWGTMNFNTETNGSGLEPAFLPPMVIHAHASIPTTEEKFGLRLGPKCVHEL